VAEEVVQVIGFIRGGFVNGALLDEAWQVVFVFERQINGIADRYDEII
jgi:hypothetical protein